MNNATIALIQQLAAGLKDERGQKQIKEIVSDCGEVVEFGLKEIVESRHLDPALDHLATIAHKLTEAIMSKGMYGRNEAAILAAAILGRK
jgi:DNA anti-recombination protein RmuC